MTTLLLQVGQCGCQLGAALHPMLQQYKIPYQPILIDTQPKVIKQLIGKSPKVTKNNAAFFQYGRGNNFALGYARKQKNIAKTAGHMRLIQQNEWIVQFCNQMIRKQVQKSQIFMGVNLFASAAGGTGSGLGTRLCQEIKDNLDCQLVGNIIFPQSTGQNPIQNYNLCLSLSKQLKVCDCIVYSCNQWYDMSLDKINQMIARQKTMLYSFSLKQQQFHFQTLLQMCGGPLKLIRHKLSKKGTKLKKGGMFYKKYQNQKQCLQIFNDKFICNYLDKALDSANYKAKQGAYLHWYEQWDCKQDLLQSIQDLYNLSDLYKSKL